MITHITKCNFLYMVSAVIFLNTLCQNSKSESTVQGGHSITKVSKNSYFPHLIFTPQKYSCDLNGWRSTEWFPVSRSKMSRSKFRVQRFVA